MNARTQRYGLDERTPGTADVLGYCFLLGTAFAAPFSLPMARVLLALSLVCVIVDRVRARRGPFVPATAWMALAFALVAGVVTCQGLHPDLGVPKLRKLVWFLAIPVCANLATSPERRAALLRAFACGTGVLSVWTLATRPMEALHRLESGRFENFLSALIDTGSMTDGQRLMLGMLVTLGFLFVARKEGQPTWGWWILLCLQTAAEVMNFKRGSWICVSMAIVAFVLIKAKWRYALILLGIIGIGVLSPPARVRLATLRMELRSDGGGRLTMWTQVAPVLIRAHPWGIGWCSLTNEMMREIAPRVERGRNHLHSNIAHVLVQTGWLGLALYLAWMAVAVWDTLVFSARGCGSERTHALVLFLMLAGLLVNGLVEYNFGDGELVMLYGLTMGCAAAGRRQATCFQVGRRVGHEAG